MKMSIRNTVQIPVCALVLLSPGIVMGALDKFSPYVYTRVVHDSNLFRVSGSQEAIALTGDDKKDDTISYLGAGLKSDLKLSRQHLLLDADVASVKYDEFDNLDHTRIRGRGAWAWQVGNRWNGNLGYKFDKDRRSFNFDSTPEKDMRTTHTSYFDAAYQLTPDWALVGVANYIDTSYQKRQSLDRVSTAGQLEAQYRNTVNTRVGMRVKFTDVNLKNDQIVNGTPVNNDYKQTDISGVFYWQGSAKSSLEARLGYTMLRYNELKNRDFDGLSGRLTYFWTVSPKTRMDLSVWREASSLAREITTYVLSQGISLKPKWSVTRKVGLEGEVSFVNDDFQGEDGIRQALGQPKREDDTWQYGVAARWTPIDMLSLRLGYRVEKRDSTIDASDFDDRQIMGQAKLTF